MKLNLAFVASRARLLLTLVALTLTAGPAFAEAATKAVGIQMPVTCGARIEAPGTYVLTQDLDCSDLTNSGRAAVEIVAGDVQFDLQGFTLRGAISVSDATRVRIANGKVDVFAAGIISMATLQFTNVQNSRVERLAVRNAGSIGAGLSINGGGNNLIRENDIRSSGEAIFLGASAVGDSIIRNYIGGAGIGLFVHDTIRETVIISNEIDGSDMGAASIRGTGILLEDCRVHHPLNVSGDRNRIRNNTITGPDRRTLLGISGTGNLIQGNVVTNSSDMVLPAGGGIYVGGSGNVIRANTVSGATAPEVDLSGPENTCTENRWRNNNFGTASPDCIR